MKITKEYIDSIAKKSKTFEDFSENIYEATTPYRPIRTAKVGEYVRIKSKTYGRKTTNEFTSPKDEGKIIKINPKSVSVRVVLYGDEKEDMKYPESALISDDLTILWTMRKDLKSYWMKISGCRPREHPHFDLNNIIERQQNRTQRSIAADSCKTSKNVFGTVETKKIWKWMKHPNRYDIFNIDTKRR